METKCNEMISENGVFAHLFIGPRLPLVESAETEAEIEAFMETLFSI